ncbi:progranulin isoform X2 [Sceloporus undulatus]|uniref:progranulin isoform X2 n=1 Tax=Sceloporus undulatus TaxID=8520 RepID=UPI001C4B3944|nr:progranulin isoform X2 [Sceloporus undulatus]
MWGPLIVCLVLGGTVFSLRCPDGNRCEGSSICCQRPGESGYACCDKSQFVGASQLMLPPDSVNELSRTVCPDGSICPADHSCLHTVDATFACCPWKEAISCADGHHCCPLGSHCSADGHSCVQSEVVTLPASVSAVQCPDHEYECPDDATCCQMLDGSWGCCPMPEASCCSDKIHCCPHGTSCDLAHERCFSASQEWALSKKFPAKKKALVLSLAEKNICPGKRSSCPDVATCCLLPTGQYGCCPLQNAVCCSDHLHCCPQGTTCDLSHSKCIMTSRWSWPITRLSVDLQKAHDVQCDLEYSCPTGNTCCKTASGEWGCCPLEEAVCCTDHIHCCPNGYQCDLEEGICMKEGRSIPWLAKTNARSAAASTGMVVPCDTQTTCPDGQTCCRLLSGAWGCCPVPQAVCCPDHIHCCPNGYSCDQSTGSCFKRGDYLPWLEKKPAILGVASESRDVRCDDETSCADGQTCCKTTTGEWGCCPLPEAVCCADHVHCCPNGYTCDPSRGTCLESQHSLPWAPKLPAQMLQSQGIPCNDTVSCEEGQTCCKSVSGAWSCCQLPNAVCCEDHQHCCPSGYTCNVAAQTCEKQEKPKPLASGGLQMSSQVSTSSLDVSCGDQHYCRDGQSCCKAQSGGWACCPYKKGSCCRDRRHCCPPGFYCSPSGFECYRKWAPRWDIGAFSSPSAQARLFL